MAGTPGQHIRILRNQLTDSNQALEDETSRTAQLKMANEYLVNEVQKGKTAYAKLENHAKECEKATERAQKSSKQDKGYAEYTVKSQKVQLKSADRRYEETARELQEWRDKYGWRVDEPAEEKLALQASLSEWQSKAEMAQNQITSFEEQIQGTPDRIGLHQALEQWDEHQDCSEGFADLEDKIHDGKKIRQKLESDLTASKQRYQKAKSDITELQSRVKQLEEASVTSQGLPITPEQVAQAEKAFQELQVKANQLEQDKQILQYQDKSQEYIQCIQKLQSDLNASTEQRQKTDVKMKALQEQNDQLQQANNAFLSQDGSHTEMLQKLDSGLKMEQEQHQTTKLEKEALQGKADQLDSDLRAAKEHNQTTKSSMEALQGKANQLDSDLRAAKEHNQTTKSGMEALQGKADQLDSDLRAQKEHNQTLKSDMEVLQDEADRLRSELETVDDEYPGPGIEVLKAEAEADRLWSEKQQKLKSEMEALEAENDQLAQARYKLDMEFLEAGKSKQVQKFNPEIVEAVRRDIEAGKSKQVEKFNPAIVEAVRRDIEAGKSKQVEKFNPENFEAVHPIIEASRKLYAQRNSRKNSEQDEKALHVENETHQESRPSQVAPPMSPIYTTDEGSLDLEKTPRPKKSLRQDLGYSSRDQSEIWKSDVSLPQYQGGKMSKPAGKSDVSLPQHQGGKMSKPAEKSDVSLPQHQGKKMSKPADKEFWESDDSDGADGLIELPVRRKMTKLQSTERHAKNMAAREIRAKEQSEAIESLFECTPTKAHTIDRRLKALGPGCRLLEAPALVAYELSGIPEDTYKGLVSGQLLATIPPKDVNDTGATLMHSIGTDTTDLLTKEVADPLFLTKDMATDTTDLPIDQSMITHTRSSSWTLSPYFMNLLMLLMILLGFFFLYMGLKSDQSLKTANGVVYKHAFSLRHTPTPSLSVATPVTFIYPPTPAPQLGLARMLMGSSSGRGMKGGRW